MTSIFNYLFHFGLVLSINCPQFETEDFYSMPVHDILSILRQPIQRKVVQMNRLLVEVEGCLESHASDVPSDIKDHTIEYAEEISGSTHEDFSGNTSDNYCKIKILKPEAVEVCVAAEKCTVSENERESQAKSSSFFLRYVYTLNSILGNAKPS